MAGLPGRYRVFGQAFEFSRPVWIDRPEDFEVSVFFIISPEFPWELQLHNERRPILPLYRRFSNSLKSC